MLKLWLLRSAISCGVALSLYLVSAFIVSRLFPRQVNRNTTRHDIRLALTSLLVGSPVIQGFALLVEHYHIAPLYEKIGSHGWGYWLLSIPVYLLLWDLVFYLGHLLLHVPLVYRKSHFRHHACRPPVAWSGIAIDGIETFLSGIFPYLVPLFFLPFHIYTVYALNIMLMVWAELLHSSLNWSGNAIFITTKDHNLHHTYGLKNSNFAAIFTIWDRIFGTLNRKDAPPWWGKSEMWKPSANTSDASSSANEPVAIGSGQ